MKPNQVRRGLFCVLLLVGASSGWQTAGGARDEVRELQLRYIDAMVKADQPQLESLVAADYFSVAATGLVLDRASTLKFYKPGELQTAAVDDLNIRVYGDTAVVIGRYTEHSKNGDWAGRFTSVWVRHARTWQLVSEHFCKLP